MIIHKMGELSHHEKFFLFVLRELKADKTPITLTYNQIGDMIGCTRGTISRVIKNVSTLGYVHVTKGEGRTASTYRLTL